VTLARGPLGEIVADFFARYPENTFSVLGAPQNQAALDLCPFGHPSRFLDASRETAWVQRYLSANRSRFQGTLELPGWVLVDLYLMPGAIGLLTCPARFLSLRPPELADRDEAIAAAYYAAPSVVAGTFVGVSLISLRAGVGAGALVKVMTLGVLRARAQRGIAQFGNASLRAHTRLGPLRLEGRVPRLHPKADESFVYSIDFSRPEDVADAMRHARAPADPPAPTGARWIPVTDRRTLEAALDRAEDGHSVTILPPGLSRDGGAVLIRNATPQDEPHGV
jgi:hypothetical protein